jgi:hypothetical protein
VGTNADPLLLVKATFDVKTCVLLSEKVAVATKFAVPVTGIVAVAGVTVIDVITFVATVIKSAGLVTVPSVAVTFAVPTATPNTNPLAETDANPVASEFQLVIWLVTFAVLESLYVPVAVSCWVPATATNGPAGVSAIDTSVAGAVTVSEALPLIPFSDAVIVDEPATTPVASPAALMVAVAGVPEAHVTWPLTSLVEPFASVAVATNCCVADTAIDGVPGVTAIVFT